MNWKLRVRQRSFLIQVKTKLLSIKTYLTPESTTSPETGNEKTEETDKIIEKVVCFLKCRIHKKIYHNVTNFGDGQNLFLDYLQ